MTLARLVNYVDGNTLTGAQLNNEFDNILNNGPSLVSASIPAVTTVQGLSGSMIANIGSFQANAYQLKSTSTICTLSATSSYSINTQTAGPIANGRDQAAVFSTTTVHFYAITTGGTSTVAAGICSTKPPTVGPTLPAGYAAWAYLASAQYSTASSGVSVTGTHGYVAGSVVYARDPTGVLSNGAATVITSQALDAGTQLVPSIATETILQTRRRGGRANAAGQMDIDLNFYPTSSGGAGPIFTSLYTLAAVASSWELKGGSEVFRLPNISNTPPSLYYQHTINSGTSASVSVNLIGYVVPNGDVG